jgi:hypothetical protein
MNHRQPTHYCDIDTLQQLLELLLAPRYLSHRDIDTEVELKLWLRCTAV